MATEGKISNGYTGTGNYTVKNDLFHERAALFDLINVLLLFA